MAQSKTNRTLKADEFDSIVIGGTLSGLIAAHLLEGTGRKVALVEALDVLGGSYRPTSSKAGTLDHGFKFLPATPEAEEMIAWLETVIGEKIPYEIVEAPPITYDDGKFKPFIGFGDTKVGSAAEFDAYAQARYLRLETTPKDWVPKLAASFTGQLFTQSYVTKMQVDDEFVIELLVNGAKRLSGRELIFCATPQQLTRFLPEIKVPTKLRQRLLKGEFWTSIKLDLIHAGTVTESEAVHILKGANEEPCVGLFQKPVTLEGGATAQVSQWLTFVPRDITDDPEQTASALKQIKRQVKRAFETSLEGLIQERIVISPTSHGDLTGLMPEDGKWPKLQNLWVISSFLDSSKNMLGVLRQTRRTVAAIAGEPPATFEHDSDLSHGAVHPTSL